MPNRSLAAVMLGSALCLLVACQPRPTATAPESTVSGGAPVVAPAAALESAPAAPLASADDLLSLLDRVDAPALSEALERLLLASEDGHKVIVEFASRCDADQNRGRLLAGTPVMLVGLARIAHLHPDESVAVALLALESVDPRSDSLVWGQVLGYAPAFLRYHGERLNDQRARLEDLVLEWLPKTAGQTRFQLLSGALRLGVLPPLDMLVSFLSTDQDFTTHQAVLRHLVDRDREGIQAIVDWLGTSADFRLQTPRTAIEMLGQLDDVAARQCIQRFIFHEHPLARDAGVRAYFGRPRSLDDLPVALDYLNSGAVLARKRYLIALIRSRSPEILEALKSTPEAVTRPEVQALLDQAQPLRTRSVETPGQPPTEPGSGAPGSTPPPG